MSRGKKDSCSEERSDEALRVLERLLRLARRRFNFSNLPSCFAFLVAASRERRRRFSTKGREAWSSTGKVDGRVGGGGCVVNRFVLSRTLLYYFFLSSTSQLKYDVRLVPLQRQPTRQHQHGHAKGPGANVRPPVTVLNPLNDPLAENSLKWRQERGRGRGVREGGGGVSTNKP